jgi:very-short-patch-repair endonuclease
MAKALDLSGQQFGHLTVLRREHKDRYGAWYWSCRCTCGRRIIARGAILVARRTSKCASCVTAETTYWTWNHWAAAYAQYIQDAGTASILYKHTLSNGRILGAWVSQQRAKRWTLSTDQRAWLESQPGWCWDPNGDRWNSTYELLVKYTNRTGTSYVPYPHVEQGVSLGAWVTDRRRDYRHGRLSPERQKRLELLPGWSWSVRESWHRIGYLHLHEYAKRWGNATPPINYICDDGYPLGQWVNSARHRRDRLDPVHRTALETLPGWLWKADQRSMIEARVCQLVCASLGECHSVRRVRVPGHRVFSVDMAIPSLAIIIEYDGYVWHASGLTRDTRKTTILTAAGWRVIRVRGNHWIQSNRGTLLPNRTLKLSM